jgi:hypothetical protein
MWVVLFAISSPTSTRERDGSRDAFECAGFRFGPPRNGHVMRVIACEPAVHPEAAREPATRLYPILVRAAARVTHSRDDIDLIDIGPSRWAGDQYIA